VLLGILVSELADLEEATVYDDIARDSSEKLTAVVRRVLPALRHYSSWLRSSCSSLHRQADETVVAHIREFWKRYAEALTVLTTTFDVTELPPVGYLLEEDLDTVAFTPLSTGTSANRYREDGKTKPKIGDAGVERLHPNQEMLARVRGLVLDGIQIVVEDVSVCNLRHSILLTSTLRRQSPRGLYRSVWEKPDLNSAKPTLSQSPSQSPTGRAPIPTVSLQQASPARILSRPSDKASKWHRPTEYKRSFPNRPQFLSVRQCII
jgi:hypothetical protein